jgi:hypothetical protein
MLRAFEYRLNTPDPIENVVQVFSKVEGQPILHTTYGHLGP